MAAEVLPVVTLIPVIRTLTLVLSSQTLFLQHHSVPMPNPILSYAQPYSFLCQTLFLLTPNHIPSFAQLVASHASCMPTPNPSPISNACYDPNPHSHSFPCPHTRAQVMTWPRAMEKGKISAAPSVTLKTAAALRAAAAEVTPLESGGRTQIRPELGALMQPGNGGRT